MDSRESKKKKKNTKKKKRRQSKEEIKENQNKEKIILPNSNAIMARHARTYRPQNKIQNRESNPSPNLSYSSFLAFCPAGWYSCLHKQSEEVFIKYYNYYWTSSTSLTTILFPLVSDISFLKKTIWYKFLNIFSVFWCKWSYVIYINIHLVKLNNWQKEIIVLIEAKIDYIITFNKPKFIVYFFFEYV